MRGDDVVSYAPLVLERRAIAVSMPYVSRHAEFVAYQSTDDFIRNQLTAMLRSHVLATRIEEQTDRRVERVPASWWQHFKQTAIRDGNPFFDPAKVKTREVVLETRFTAWATFPSCERDYPSLLGPPVVQISRERL